MQQSHPEVPAWFLETPAGRELVERECVAAREQRRQLGSEVKELEYRAEAEVKPLRVEEVRAAARLEKLRAPFLQAQEEHKRAVAARYALERSLSVQIDARRGELARTAPPEIAAFIREMQELDRHFCRGGIQVGTANSRTDPVSGHRVADTYSNEGSLREVLAAVRSARDEAETMKSRYVEDLEAEFDRLRRTIPALRSAELVSA